MTTAQKALTYFRSAGIPRTRDQVNTFCVAYVVSDLCRDLIEGNAQLLDGDTASHPFVTRDELNQALAHLADKNDDQHKQTCDLMTALHDEIRKVVTESQPQRPLATQPPPGSMPVRTQPASSAQFLYPLRRSAAVWEDERNAGDDDYMRNAYGDDLERNADFDERNAAVDEYERNAYGEEYERNAFVDDERNAYADEERNADERDADVDDRNAALDERDAEVEG